jgi:hypothetical protein
MDETDRADQVFAGNCLWQGGSMSHAAMTDAQLTHVLSDAAADLLRAAAAAGGSVPIGQEEESATAEVEDHSLGMTDDRLGGTRIELTPRGLRIAALLAQDLVSGGRRRERVRRSVLDATSRLEQPHPANAALVTPGSLDPEPTGREVASAARWLGSNGLVELVELAELTMVSGITPAGEDALYSGARLSSAPRTPAPRYTNTQHVNVIGDNSTLAMSFSGDASARSGHPALSSLDNLRAQITEQLSGTDQSTALVLVDDLEKAALSTDTATVKTRGQVILSFLERFGPSLLTLAGSVVKALSG